MGISPRAILAGLLVACAMTAAAHAESGGADDLVKRMFAGDTGKAKLYACFVRRYDAAHLKQHPQQKVSAMKLLVTAAPAPEDTKLAYSFRLGVTFRDRSGNFESMGDCAHYHPEDAQSSTTAFGCGVDCDGGGLGADLADDNASIVVTLDHGIRIWKNKKFEEDGATELTAGTDDKVFRLDRAALSACADLAAGREELADLRRK
jgi:hypothetical protein